MTEPQDVLAETAPVAPNGDYDAAEHLQRLTRAGYALVRTPETLDGTTTDCPLEGVHEHAFRGPHRFHEWDPADYASPTPPEGLLDAANTALRQWHGMSNSRRKGKPLETADDEEAVLFREVRATVRDAIRLAASPAPDPGAEPELERLLATWDERAKTSFHAHAWADARDELRAALAPSAEPPETETTP